MYRAPAPTDSSNYEKSTVCSYPIFALTRVISKSPVWNKAETTQNPCCKTTTLELSQWWCLKEINSPICRPYFPSFPSGMVDLQASIEAGGVRPRDAWETCPRDVSQTWKVKSNTTLHCRSGAGWDDWTLKMLRKAPADWEYKPTNWNPNDTSTSDGKL